MIRKPIILMFGSCWALNIFSYRTSISEVQDISKISWRCFPISVVEKPRQKVYGCV